MFKYIKTVINGFCMAIANSVPGVSGGTIAVLMGFFDDFIGAFNDIIYNKGKRLKGLFYVGILGIGWATGMIASMLVLDKLLVTNIYDVSSVFFGFVLCSIPFMIWDERECLKGKYYNIIFTVIGFALISALTYFSTKLEATRDLASFTLPLGIMLFFVGALSIIAMILPGISGSTIFLVFGVYQPITEAFASVLSLDFSPFVSLCFLGLGAATGGIVGVKGIKICLDKFRSQTVHLVIGMLIGSLYSIMMGPVTLDMQNKIEWMSPARFNWWCLVGGALLIGVLEAFKFVKAKKEDETVSE